MLRNTSSPETYFQSAFRVQSPWTSQAENNKSNIKEIIQPANYNCPGQLVISGEKNAVKTACEELTKLGAKRAIILPVNGAFHSELMISAAEELEHAINQTEFNNPICPIYQNVSAQPVVNTDILKRNLIEQLISPVKWNQTIENMIKNGASNFTEIGPGKVLQGLIKKINPNVTISSFLLYFAVSEKIV